MSPTIALAGDTMLGRGVAEVLATASPASLFAPEVAEATRGADRFVLNLECCISQRGERWPDPAKPFFFRAPPVAVEVLTHLGVDCVTLANNHALDYGADALLDTLESLEGAGISVVGAGVDVDRARAPVVLEIEGFRLAVIGVTDHPRDFAADADAPGVAFADLTRGVPEWLVDTISGTDADAVLVTPHWGPNMTPEPVAHVRAAGRVFLDAGATIVAGHSAHVFHGVAVAPSDPRCAILHDLGDFIDDYAVHPHLRNDLGLLFFVTLDEGGVSRIEALPLELDYCLTRPATGADAAWIRDRFAAMCAAFGTEVSDESGRLVIDL